jgi:hypothetical protein
LQMEGKYILCPLYLEENQFKAKRLRNNYCLFNFSDKLY